ncbi:MAG: PAS domain-containing sensor histidine kinase [Rhodospirillaceae bacterium]|nr:PAS domain-containing sensor histidine kinase [Rhodospirillales bacterium]
MPNWLGGDGLSPHGFCLTWDPALLAAHTISDAVMGLSYMACGVVIFWFGRRRPDMAPPALFWSLAVVFILCGVVHLSDIATIWVAAYEPQAVLKVTAAVASGVTISVLGVLAPRALLIPSVTQLQDVNARLLEEKEQHERTARRLARLAMAVEQNPNIIIITDQDGTIEYVNGAFEVMTGYDRSTAIGASPSIIASGTTPGWVYDNLWHSVRGQGEWRGELQDRRRDGSEFWVASSIAPMHDSNGAVDGFVAIQQDISDRKAVEAEMQVAKRQAEIANKAKSELLANMSHELRTPLNAIIGFAEMMKAEMFGPLGAAKYAEYITDIHNSGRHLLDLINDVLDVSAIEAGKLTLFEERVPVSSLVSAAVRMVAERAETQGVDLRIAPVPEVDVVVDQRRLKQVLINLLSNAVKFTPASGQVVVSVDLAKDHLLSISVADTGIGMTEDEIDLALQVFGQVDGSLQRRHEGTGLGLPICMGIMDRHGGSLRVLSAKAKGTTVIATLPSVRVFAAAEA